MITTDFSSMSVGVRHLEFMGYFLSLSNFNKQALTGLSVSVYYPVQREGILFSVVVNKISKTLLDGFAPLDGGLVMALEGSD